MNSATLNFISKLLSDALQLDFHYFSFPHYDISNFDRYLRKSLLNTDLLYDQIRDFINTLDYNSFHVVTDNYFINYIIFFPFQDKQDIITIGPYFSHPITPEYWSSITEINQLTLNDKQSLKAFLYGIPPIENNLRLISIVSDIVTYINPDSPPFSIKYHTLSDHDNETYIYTPKDDFEAYSASVAKRYETEHNLLRFICNGDWKNALLEAKKFVSSPFEPRMENSLRDQKALLLSANTLFRKAIESNEIHPIHLHEISSKYANMIENLNSSNELNQLYEKMIREYCFLVQNKSTRQYSPNIRKVLHYIEFNLDLPLALADIADQFQLSVPYISSLFKKEVGTPINKYINQLRIQAAIRLLNTSSMTIQDISAHVGINDYNYFTKVFKKEVGMTPSEYRKKTSKKTVPDTIN